ncbi:MAG: AAC(3) family N-acetyltransferase [Candidatus Electrothrix sp. Rat3]|nr:AAC(3) family N-acetyltransferase [Candidatus Electrothrix rattekaaiensis]
MFTAHLSAIQELLGETGTLIVPTHSWSLCNTSKVFDIKRTPSETGPFTEYIRKQKSSVRQLHPFSSSTALGKEAMAICANTSKHAYGPESPFQRMIDRNALYVSIGLPIELTISLVHHIELVMGVPYRYVKEFIHPIKVDNELKNIAFYLYVIRRECQIERDCNVNILNEFKKSYSVKRSSLGRSIVESLSTAEFFQAITKVFAKNIYIWLKKPPKKRISYQQ